jgi:hypothetical protein
VLTPIGGAESIYMNEGKWVPQATHYLHPLDMVTLILEGPDGKPQTLIVPAIFVKDVAFHTEWVEVMKIIRIAIDIFIIIVSVATLVTGPVGLALAISLIDLGLATIDIPVQVFADEIGKTDLGKEFLKLWET